MTLAEKIRARQFVITGELTPPKGADLSDLFAKADVLKTCVDAINITDSPRARLCVEPKAVGHLLLDRGIEPIIQVTARDRNRIAIQADLLGGAVLGLHNYVFMSGDPPTQGDQPQAKGVFDWNASDMLRAVQQLNDGRDAGGAPLQGAVQLFVGATANPSATDFAAEVANTRRKIGAGAQFLQTQAMFEPDVLKRFVDAVKPDGVALLVGIIPVKSLRSAQWLNDNLPGVRVPDALLDTLAEAGAEREAQVGIDSAARTIRSVRSLCAGVHVMAMGAEARVPEIVAASGLR